MKTFTLSEIDDHRGTYRRLAKEIATVDCGGRTYTYFVLPAQVCPAELPNAVLRVTPATNVIRESPHPEEIMFFGISESVPEKFRRFAILHEIHEFMHVGIECSGRCVTAALVEIIAVKESDLTRDEKQWYFRMRRKFFLDLIAVARQSPESYSRDDMEEFMLSHSAFDKVVIPK